MGDFLNNQQQIKLKKKTKNPKPLKITYKTTIASQSTSEDYGQIPKSSLIRGPICKQKEKIFADPKTNSSSRNWWLLRFFNCWGINRGVRPQHHHSELGFWLPWHLEDKEEIKLGLFVLLVCHCFYFILFFIFWVDFGPLLLSPATRSREGKGEGGKETEEWVRILEANRIQN